MQLVLTLSLLGALSLLPACGDKASQDDTATPGEGEGEGEGEGADGLPDLISHFDTTGCDTWTDPEDGVVYETTGAVSYFYGVYEDNGDGSWSGEEYWYLYANASWVEAGEGDCQIMWVASGTEGDPGACPSCDVALDVTLQLDASQTDCPEEIYEGEESATTSYAIKHTTSSDAVWYYASSGNQFGTGYYNSSAMNFATEHACKWF